MPESNVTIIAHFLKGNLKSAPSHALFPNPGLCLVTYTINKAVAFIEINREMCGDRARELVLEAKNETLIIMHSEMWEDSSNPVKES